MWQPLTHAGDPEMCHFRDHDSARWEERAETEDDTADPAEQIETPEMETPGVETPEIEETEIADD